ncbi:MAG: hypothetical protein HN353_05865 [Bdellovibrionales bacterium]|jgi:hypothetical protein|nr:hypothetical protein [Bdellovibrionales bacterium]MBT3527083.1 hypothetical protein [Bdellovibrionales bacterium]MBT7670172.1 hypothetical protein [Bdellovibrionales bacterium]MBT7767764.1 hypothetical protein [Bdellovibrionales bacterium]
MYRSNKKIVDLEQSGQSTIEFLSGFIVMVSFIFIFVDFALNLTNGYLVHYATFMASRSYLVGDNNSNDPIGSEGHAMKNAKKVFKQYMYLNLKGKLRFNQGLGGEDVKKVYVGAYYQYSPRFSSAAILTGNKKMNFISESFLGREPSKASCLDRVCRAIKDLGGDCQNHTSLIDNGC